MSLSRQELVALVESSRAAQGLPPRITDPAVLATLARLIVTRRRARTAAAKQKQEGAHQGAA